MHCVQQRLAKMELVLNPIDRIPMIASFSGMIRILAGGVQMVAGTAFALIRSMYSYLQWHRDYRDKLQEGVNHSLHGLLNIVRGAIALLPPVNLLLWVYDFKVGRINYYYETLTPNTYPLASHFQESWND